MLMPFYHVSTVRQEEEIMLYAILKVFKISFGKLIEQSILRYQSSNFWGHMPHLTIITYLCIKEGVKFNREEEERCSKTSTLTLTSITKPPSDKGKGKLKEIEEDGRNGEQKEHAIVLS